MIPGTFKILSGRKEFEMKLFEFIKKRKVEEAPKSEIKRTEIASNVQKEIKVEEAPRSRELYLDDNDIGYC